MSRSEQEVVAAYERFLSPEEASKRRQAARKVRNERYKRLIVEALREHPDEWVDRDYLISEIAVHHQNIRRHELDNCYSYMALNAEIASKRDFADSDRVVCRLIPEDLRPEAKALVQEAWHRVHELVDTYQAILSVKKETRFGSHLRDLREASNLSHEDVSLLMDGRMSPKHVQAVEDGHMQAPTRKTIKQLAMAVGDDHDVLLSSAGVVPRYVRRLIAKSDGARRLLRVAEKFDEDAWQELIDYAKGGRA